MDERMDEDIRILIGLLLAIQHNNPEVAAIIRELEALIEVVDNRG